MKILIVGSTRHQPCDVEALRDACREIGAAIAKQGHRILTGSDNADTVDRYVVEGANSVPGRHEVMIYRPASGRGDGLDHVVPFLQERSALGHLNIRYFHLEGPWNVAHTAAIRDADVVLVIGGEEFANLVSRIAPILGRPVLPIPLFGGAANEIWGRLQSIFSSAMTQDERQRLTILWDSSSGAAVVSVLERLHQEFPVQTPGPDGPTRILSLSGGGIRGIFQAAYLAEITARLGHPIAKHFDLIAGTSTGAIIALGVSLGIDIHRVVGLFEDHGREIFPPSIRKRSKGTSSWLGIGPQYDQVPLLKWLEYIFRGPGGKQLRLKDCKPPVVIAAGTLDKYEPRIFTSLPRRGNRADHPDINLFASQVALSSAAAPLFFPAVSPRGETDTGKAHMEAPSYVDGGVCANNPALLAIMEAHRHLGAPFEEMRVVSIGNGEVPVGEVGVDFNKMRRFKMIQPILDMMFAMQSELADKATASLLRDPQMKHRMLRVNVNLKQFIDLDDVDEAIRKLKPRAAIEADNTFDSFMKLIRN